MFTVLKIPFNVVCSSSRHGVESTNMSNAKLGLPAKVTPDYNSLQGMEFMGKLHFQVTSPLSLKFASVVWWSYGEPMHCMFRYSRWDPLAAKELCFFLT